MCPPPVLERSQRRQMRFAARPLRKAYTCGNVRNSAIFRASRSESAATRLPVALEIVANLIGGDPARADIRYRQHPLPTAGQDDVDDAPPGLGDPATLDLRPGDPLEGPAGADDEMLGRRSHLETE